MSSWPQLSSGASAVHRDAGLRDAPSGSPEPTPEMPLGPRHPTRLCRASLQSPQSMSAPSCCSSQVTCVSCFASAVTASPRQGRRKQRDPCCPPPLTFPLAALLRSLQGSVGRHSRVQSYLCRQIKKELTYWKHAPYHSSTEPVQCVVGI